MLKLALQLRSIVLALEAMDRCLIEGELGTDEVHARLQG
jgi:hypothetical protein